MPFFKITARIEQIEIYAVEGATAEEAAENFENESYDKGAQTPVIETTQACNDWEVDSEIYETRESCKKNIEESYW